MRDLHRILLSSEVRELNEEVGRLLDDLARTRGPHLGAHGHCTPPLDVLQTDSTVEVVMDLPGVTADRLRLLLKEGVLLIVGEKASPYPGEPLDATFHLVERAFGLFARAVRLEGAIDGSAARGVLRDGELRVTIPRIPERRGQEIRVPVTSA